MGAAHTREICNPREPNTYLAGVCAASLMFNSVQRGRLLATNFFFSTFLVIMLWMSNGCAYGLQEPDLGSRLGVAASTLFTVGPPLKLMYTQLLFPRRVHYGIGCAFMTYNSLQLYCGRTYFEDAMEDDE